MENKENEKEKFVEREWDENIVGEYDDQGFFNTPNGSFWDPDGVYFNRNGFDKHGGHYENDEYIPGEGWDENNNCYDSENEDKIYKEDEEEENHEENNQENKEENKNKDEKDNNEKKEKNNEEEEVEAEDDDSIEGEDKIINDPDIEKIVTVVPAEENDENYIKVVTKDNEKIFIKKGGDDSNKTNEAKKDDNKKKGNKKYVNYNQFDDDDNKEK